MNDTGVKKRLSAILAADMVGYTRLLEQDTDGTVAAWTEVRRTIIDPTIESHSGRIVKHTGDGFLAEFQTVLEAVRCGIEIQEKLEDNPLVFRIGINLGDIVDDGEDIHGEGVNIAARLEGLANPGGICISGGVYDQIRNQISVPFVDIGEQTVKHVTAPVRVYSLSPDGVEESRKPGVKPDDDAAATDKLVGELNNSGWITLFVAPGIAVMGVILNFISEGIMVPLFWVSLLLGFIGLCLILSAKIVKMWN